MFAQHDTVSFMTSTSISAAVHDLAVPFLVQFDAIALGRVVKVDSDA